ncbi:MAG: phosphatidylglycerol lysyltransferase domain-containing protein [Polyangiales bacterium]
MPGHHNVTGLHAALCQHGGARFAFQGLERGHTYFAVPELPDAYIAYRSTSAAWVSIGPPVAPAPARQPLATAFITAAARQGKRALFFGVDANFAATLACTHVPVAEEAVWDARHWPHTLRAVASLRAQLRRASAQHVTVRHVCSPPWHTWLTPSGPLTELRRAWLATRPMPALDFLVQHDLTSVTAARQLWTAHRHGTLVAALIAVPIEPRRGWFAEHIWRHPDAPNGAVEALVDALMRWAAAQGQPEVSLGMVPVAQANTPSLRWALGCVRTLYNTAGLRQFRAKMRPARWEMLYLAYPRRHAWLPLCGPLVTLHAIWQVLRLFVGGAPLRFLVRTCSWRWRAAARFTRAAHRSDGLHSHRGQRHGRDGTHGHRRAARTADGFLRRTGVVAPRR